MRTPPADDVRAGTESRSRRVLTSLGLLCACALIGLLSATQNNYVDRAEGETVTWAAMLWSQLTYWIVWGVFLPLIVYATRKISHIRRLPTQVAVQVVAGLLTVLLHSLVVFGIRSMFAGGSTQPASFSLYVRAWLVLNLVIYSALAAGALADRAIGMARTGARTAGGETGPGVVAGAVACPANATATAFPLQHVEHRRDADSDR